MNFRFICREGPLKGEEYTAKESFQLGRSVGDLQLKDSKTSNPHAKIFNDPNGLLTIEDLGSSNGTWVNGVRIHKATPLKIGDKISLGKTVIEVEGGKKETESSKGSWQEKVELALDEALIKAQANVKSIAKSSPPSRAFDQTVVLDFAQGIQTGQTLVFGYGPRRVGLYCNDGLLNEEKAPPVAFELLPIDGHLCELRASTENIQVNGEPVKVQKLKNGDRISVGQAVIVIRAFTPI